MLSHPDKATRALKAILSTDWRRRFLAFFMLALSVLHITSFSKAWPHPWHNFSWEQLLPFIDSLSNLASFACYGLSLGICAYIYLNFLFISLKRSLVIGLSSLLLIIPFLIHTFLIDSFISCIRINSFSFWIAACIPFMLHKVIKTSTTTRLFNLQIPFSFLFFLSFNALLLIAPYSELVPSSIQTPSILSPNFGRITYVDALSVEENPIYLSLRAIFSFCLGSSIAINNFVSIALASFAFALLSHSIQRLLDQGITAIAMILLLLTDKWCLSTALAGNLVVTPFPLIAFAVYAYLSLTGWQKPNRVFNFSLILQFAGMTAYALYAYAAARPFWLLSIGLFGFIFFIQGVKSEKFSRAALSTLVFITLQFATLLVITYFSYKGNLSLALSHASNEPRLVLPSEVPDEAKPRREPDRPIWYGSAVLPNGEHLWWKRSTSESILTFTTHIKDIYKLDSRNFPISFDIYILAIFGILNFVIVCRPPRSSLIYGMIAIATFSSTSFLLLDDQLAYRRSVGLSVVLQVFILLSFISRVKAHKLTNPGLSVATLLLLIIYVTLRAPKSLDFALNSDARKLTSAHCQSAMPIRELFLSETPEFWRNNKFVVAVQERSHPHYRICMSGALQSEEFRRILTRFTTYEISQGGLFSALSQQPKGSFMLIDCSRDAKRDTEVNKACNGFPIGGKLVRHVPRISDYYNTYWAIIEII